MGCSGCVIRVPPACLHVPSCLPPMELPLPCSDEGVFGDPDRFDIGCANAAEQVPVLLAPCCWLAGLRAVRLAGGAAVALPPPESLLSPTTVRPQSGGLRRRHAPLHRRGPVAGGAGGGGGPRVGEGSAQGALLDGRSMETSAARRLCDRTLPCCSIPPTTASSIPSTGGVQGPVPPPAQPAAGGAGEPAGVERRKGGRRPEGAARQVVSGARQRARAERPQESKKPAPQAAADTAAGRQGRPCT